MKIHFGNGIGNFVMLTPALAALEKRGESPIVYMDESDRRFKSVKDISLWPVLPVPESGFKPDFSTWPMKNNFGKEQPTPKWKTGIHEAQAYLDFIGEKERFKSRIKHSKRLTLHIGKNEKLIAFGNGSDHPNGLKKLPNEKWISLAEKLIKKKYQIVFLGSQDEGIDTGAALVKAHGRKVWNLAGELSLAESADVLTQASAFVTTDSALMHVSDAVGCKTICLWGPTLWSKNSPWNGNGIQIKTDACAPCFGTAIYHQCNDFICMNSITTEMVMGEI